MTLLIEETSDALVVEEAAPNNLARWHIRAAALAVDILPGTAVVASMALVGWAVPLYSTWWFVSLAVLFAAVLMTMVNRIVLPSTTGWSLGRGLVGIVVERPDGPAVGMGRLMARDLAHLLDTGAVFVGWLWPLWDRRQRTFADLLLGTEVLNVEPAQRPRGIGRYAADIAAAAALLCIAAGAVSAVQVYLPDRAADQARAAIADQGPKIVAGMLTFDPKSLHDQFAHALSLTTDQYRPRLLAQQELAQKRRPMVNEYWPTNWAVLSATRNRATMLVFLLGHRGEGNEHHPISATVRVTFVEANDGRWLVDDLEPVKGGQ